MADKYATSLDNVVDPLTVHKFSEEWAISRKEAVKVLEMYVKNKSTAVNRIWALYEISGTVSSSEFPFLASTEKITKHLVVPESDLESEMAKFEEILSTSLHSVQRTNPKDTRVYGRAWNNNDDLKGVSVPQQEQKQKKAEEKNPAPESIVKKEKSMMSEPSASSCSSKLTETETSGAAAVSAKKNKTTTTGPPKKQASVMNMFARKTKERTPKKEKKSASPPAQKTRKRPIVEIDEEEEKPVKKEKSPERSTMFNASDDDFLSSRETSVEKEHSPQAKRHKNETKENVKAQKTKRKLLLPESDEEKEKAMKVEAEELTNEKKVEKSNERRRTTRMEKVVETYVDEDGYLVSKEVQKTVECSSKNSPEKKPKIITAAVPGTSKTTKKNATITSFFKKQ
ncbi:unnamed protein product [Caenorhabditis sp. 36 PRJEB53466]|nr:unnamed protein product [Caenorhabditis sp. 36 PRJEB53466]